MTSRVRTRPSRYEERMASAAESLRRQWRDSCDRILWRLEGLTDDEYRWEPVADCWNVRPSAETEFVPVSSVFPERRTPSPYDWDRVSWKWAPRKSFPSRRDTTTEAAAVQVEVLRKLSPSRRMEIALEMSEELADVAAAGERSRANGRPSE